MQVAKDKLFVRDDDSRRVYRITWFLADDGDHGADLGDGDEYTDADLADALGDDRPHIVACMAAAKSDGVERDRRGYFWESHRDAATALRACNIAIKNDGGPPWPEWATKAAAEGWKAPKGWKPS